MKLRKKDNAPQHNPLTILFKAALDGIRTHNTCIAIVGHMVLKEPPSPECTSLSN